MPSPQISGTQVALQPSPEIVLPSSHCSGACVTPLPQTWLKVQTLGLPAQVKPLSTVQLEVQPSPAAALPSSHGSGDSTSALVH